MFASLMADLIGIDAPPLACIALAGRHGFAGIDLRLNRQADLVEAVGVEALRSAMRDAGVVPGYCSLLPHNMAVDDELWGRAVEDLPRLADWALKLGYTRTSSVILPFHEALPFDLAFEQLADRVSEAMDILGDFGLRLGLEYVSPVTRRAGKPHPFIHDLRGAMKLVDACGQPGVGLMLDTFHWHCAGETIDDLARLPADRVVVVHVNDAPRRPVEQQVVSDRELPGDTGVIDVGGFMGALRGIGYAGPVTAEPTNARWRTLPPEEVCARTAGSIQRYLGAPC